MRTYGLPILIALLTVPATPAAGATFGTVVSIGGEASDVALDQTRGLLYIANFTANQIQVMNVATNSIQTSINVAAPGSISLSPDAQYLLVATFGNTSPAVPSANQITLIHLPDYSRQTFTTGDPPLGVAFFSTQPVTGPSNLTGPGKALVVTTTAFYILDPATDVLSVLSTVSNVANTTPATVPTFPGQLLETAITTAGNGTMIWGIGGAGTGTQLVFQYNALTNQLSAITYVSSPALLPRVSVAFDGSYAMVGWILMNSNFISQGKFPDVVSATTVTGHVIDSAHGLIYGEIPNPNTPQTPPYISAPAGSAASTGLPTLLVMASDNLTVLDRILIPEDLTGRIVMNTAGTTLYAISDSGVTVLPVGSLSKAHRLSSDHQDLLLQTTFCDRALMTGTFSLSDPGGNATDFTISPTQPGVSVSPAAGTTPATITVTVDPNQFTTEGTMAVSLNIVSQSSVDIPPAVRLLVNTPDEVQRGSVVDIPGVLTDIMPDPARNRFYVVRQDINQLEVFDGTSNQMITALRTYTTPTMMSMTTDGNYLLVANDNSQFVNVFDLNALQADTPITLPGGHYGHSVAASNAAILVMANNNATNTGVIDSVSLGQNVAVQLATLNIWANNALSTTAVLTASPNGANILVVDPNGTAMLYSAQGNTFVAATKDSSSFSGAFAASSYQTFVIGNTVYDSSLVPVGSLSATTGATSGFAFTGQGGYQVTAASASTAGVIQNLPSLTSAQVSPIAMVEAPVLPSTTLNFTRTVAPLSSANTILVLSTSGVTVLSSNYAAATTPPSIASVQNAADGSTSVAPGGLISVYGSSMSATSMATSQIPLPTALGQSCLVVNGAPIPLLFVSTAQINAQLPFNVGGDVTMTIHTPAGDSNNFGFVVQPAAPAIFLTGTAGPETGLPTVFLASNGQLVTATNPVRPNDTLVIYLTGMGPTSPVVPAGMETPSTLLTSVLQTPIVTLDGATLEVQYAGLVPGFVSGLYQINATVPANMTTAASTPLVISQAGGSTTLNVRVVN